MVAMAKWLFNTFCRSICDIVKSFILSILKVYFYSQYPLYLCQRLVYLVVESLALLEVVGKELGIPD